MLRVDTQAALAALFKGSSPSDMAGVLVDLFRNVAARGNTRWWIEYVNAKSNAADYPSRQREIPAETARHVSQGDAPFGFRVAFAS